ncbi:Putative uncharacterized protein FLJ37770 [Eumeta japonica]|uniref:Mos1 transposase HTH domain-containing protein n=1 Tax=Eumeta variegata TaxID=151549 RepID=A0A4C1SDK8_EUMVA|nr:Putative uncharacterized protein FLJ37770 [Eumeta japonica]
MAKEIPDFGDDEFPNMVCVEAGRVAAPIVLLPGTAFEASQILQQSFARFRTAFGDKAPRKMTIYNWFAECKRGRVNLSDEFRDGRPSTAVNNKSIDAVHRLIKTDRHVTYHEIRASLGMDMNQIQSILPKHLESPPSTAHLLVPAGPAPHSRKRLLNERKVVAWSLPRHASPPSSGFSNFR